MRRSVFHSIADLEAAINGMAPGQTLSSVL
jgi:hypothetical protein